MMYDQSVKVVQILSQEEASEGVFCKGRFRGPLANEQRHGMDIIVHRRSQIWHYQMTTFQNDCHLDVLPTCLA